MNMITKVLWITRVAAWSLTPALAQPADLTIAEVRSNCAKS